MRQAEKYKIDILGYSFGVNFFAYQIDPPLKNGKDRGDRLVRILKPRKLGYFDIFMAQKYLDRLFARITCRAQYSNSDHLFLLKSGFQTPSGTMLYIKLKNLSCQLKSPSELTR